MPGLGKIGRLPAVINATGMPYILGGAWMGGTIDATGAVAAAGAFLSESALYVAATIKMIQNVLIGATAFGSLNLYWDFWWCLFSSLFFISKWATMLVLA